MNSQRKITILGAGHVGSHCAMALAAGAVCEEIVLVDALPEKAAAQALEFVGLPEARLSIVQAIIFLCESPKSNSVVMAMDAAFQDAESIPEEPVPIHLRDTSFYGADKLGHGKGYKYPHDYPGHVVAQEYMPPSVKGRRY